MKQSDILAAGQKKFPKLRGDAFLLAYAAGDGAQFLYDAVQRPGRVALPFGDITAPLAALADRIADRLAAIFEAPSDDALASYPHPHIVEVTQLLALVFNQPPVERYASGTVGARFWNWWHWTADSAQGNRISEMRQSERLAAGAAALAMFRADTPVSGRC